MLSEVRCVLWRRRGWERQHDDMCVWSCVSQRACDLLERPKSTDDKFYQNKSEQWTVSVVTDESSQCEKNSFSHSHTLTHTHTHTCTQTENCCPYSATLSTDTDKQTTPGTRRIIFSSALAFCACLHFFFCVFMCVFNLRVCVHVKPLQRLLQTPSSETQSPPNEAIYGFNSPQDLNTTRRISGNQSKDELQLQTRSTGEPLVRLN